MYLERATLSGITSIRYAQSQQIGKQIIQRYLGDRKSLICL